MFANDITVKYMNVMAYKCMRYRFTFQYYFGCQEKSYQGEIVPKRNRTQIEWERFLQKSYPGYDFTRDIVPRVRFLQRYRTLFIQYYFVVYCTVEKYTYALFKFIKYFKTCKYFSS